MIRTDGGTVFVRNSIPNAGGSPRGGFKITFNVRVRLGTIAGFCISRVSHSGVSLAVFHCDKPMSIRVAPTISAHERWGQNCDREFGAWTQEVAAAKQFVACRSGARPSRKGPTAGVRARLWGRKEGKRLSFLISSFCSFEAFITIPLGLQGDSCQGHQPPVPCSVRGMNCMEPDKRKGGTLSHPTFVGLVLRYMSLCFPYG